MRFRIYRYDPDKDAKPRHAGLRRRARPARPDAARRAGAHQGRSTTRSSFRRSCREGVCGSDAMNINGKNGLACITKLDRAARSRSSCGRCPGLPVIRDLIVDMSAVLQAVPLDQAVPGERRRRRPRRERLQSPEEREELNGLYECILCACCSTSCPSFWWNPDKFVGPAGLLQAYRFIADSRDQRPERAARQPRGSVPAVPLPHDHELRRRVPEEPQSDAGDRQDQGSAGAADGEQRQRRWTAQADSQSRWHCRRGMLELDLVLERFLDRHLERLRPRRELERCCSGTLLDACRIRSLLDLVMRVAAQSLDGSKHERAAGQRADPRLTLCAVSHR